jgi:hypothetical protein
MEELTKKDINFEYLKKDGLQICKVPNGKYFLYQYNEEKRQNEKVKPYPLDRKYILQAAFDKGMKTIFWKNKVYLTSNASKWINDKIIEIQHHYLSSLHKMRFIGNAKNIICGRNEINYRLDTNITSSPSKMLQYVRSSKGEQPMNFDLSNSQLAFFGAGTYHLERLFNFGELERMFQDDDNGIFNSSLIKDNIYKEYGINIIIDTIKHMVNIKDLEVIKKDKNRSRKYKNINTRGIINTVFTSSPMIARITAAQKWANYSKLGEFRKICASGRVYEYFASKLYEKRYKGVFSDCATFEELERKSKYSQSIKNDNGRSIGGIVQLHYNLSTFGKPAEHYKKELKAIRNDVKRLTFQTIFPHHSQSNDLKKMLKELHPAVVEFIDGFKKEFASPNFANFLSRLESSVFIDGIYCECLERGLEVHPKHDGIIYFPSERKRVMGVIMKHMNAFFGKGNYKYEIEDIVEKYK